MQGAAAQAIGISFTCYAKNPNTCKMNEPYSGQRDFSWGGVSFRIQTRQSTHDEHPFETLNVEGKTLMIHNVAIDDMSFSG